METIFIKDGEKKCPLKLIGRGRPLGTKKPRNRRLVKRFLELRCQNPEMPKTHICSYLAQEFSLSEQYTYKLILAHGY